MGTCDLTSRPSKLLKMYQNSPKARFINLDILNIKFIMWECCNRSKEPISIGRQHPFKHEHKTPKYKIMKP